MGKDKDFTITSKLFLNENHLFMGEYRQTLNNLMLCSILVILKVIKKHQQQKIVRQIHFFKEFVKIFSNNDKSDANLKIKTQNVSDEVSILNFIRLILI